ncbi:hypothetical protein COHA_007324 [Chlorella ohadii]|uniref:Uncharacterized protein n=1 Tax=Chlorella ohadii TaxID=2649997 RepID=A0AAD5DM73_9CHLO|nr:hypothetical protein COHA_007324 [Chlorella ohadii]
MARATLALLLVLAALLAPLALAATGIHPPRWTLLGSRRALAEAQPSADPQPAADEDAPALFSLTMAERLELVDLSEHTELLSAPRSAGTGAGTGAALRLDVDAALAAGYSQRSVMFLAEWYEQQAATPTAAATPATDPMVPRSLPSVAVRAVLKAVAKNWSKIVGVVERVIGRAAAAKYFNLAKFQGALEAALAASDAIDAALTTAVSFLLPSFLQWAVTPLVWALRTFVIPL